MTVVSVEVKRFSLKKMGVTVLMVNGDPWFLLPEVCQWLGITNPSDARKQLDADEYHLIKAGSKEFKALASSYPLDARVKQLNLISESGFYSLVMRSKKAMDHDHIAYKFRKWVTKTVLPTIRKTGNFGHPDHGPGAAHIDYTPPRTPPGEVEVYSPPATEARVIEMQQQFFTQMAEQMPDLMKRALEHGGKGSIIGQLKSKVRVYVAEEVADETSDLEEEIEGVKDHVVDLEQEVKALKKNLTSTRSELAKLRKAVREVHGLIEDAADDATVQKKLRAIEKRVKKLEEPVYKPPKKRRKADKRTIN